MAAENDKERGRRKRRGRVGEVKMVGVVLQMKNVIRQTPCGPIRTPLGISPAGAHANALSFYRTMASESSHYLI